MRFIGKTDYDHATTEKLGVLITNLGTPESPTPASLRKYLAEFLWDPRVVEFPRPLWWLVLNLIILRVRPKSSAATYSKIWTQDGSPLMMYTKAQCAALQKKMAEDDQSSQIVVDFAMRYGSPSIESVLMDMQNKNVTRLLVLPLYPQYSGTTTGSTFDAIASVCKKLRWIPELRFINQYADNEKYIQACANRITQYWQQHKKSERLLFSFHGLPKRYLLAGDPYHCQCYKTARLIAQKLQLDESTWQVAFQSRFGREEWLQPYTDKTLESMPANKISSVDVFCPGFSADCVETLEEINILNRDIFIQAGGDDFNYIPALNECEDHIDAIYDLIMQHMQGWPLLGVNEYSKLEQNKLTQQQYARKLGAAR